MAAMFEDQSFLKLLFAITFLNVFVLLEPFINKHGYRTIVFDKKKGFGARMPFFLGVNLAIFGWALVLSVRVWARSSHRRSQASWLP
jgi:hypothetical protein